MSNINAIRCIVYNFVSTMLFKCCRLQPQPPPAVSPDKFGFAEKEVYDDNRNIEIGTGVRVRRLDLEEDEFDRRPYYPCLRCCCYGNAIAPLQEAAFVCRNNPSIILTSPSSAEEREIRDHGFPHKPVMAPRQFGSPQTNDQGVSNTTNLGYPSSNRYVSSYIHQDTTSETEPPSANLDDSTDVQDSGGGLRVDEVAQIQPPPELQASPRLPTPQPPMLQITSSPIPLALTPTSPRTPSHLQDVRSQQPLPPHMQEIRPTSMTPLDMDNYISLSQPNLQEAVQKEHVDSSPEVVPDVDKSPVKRRINRPTMKPGRLRRGASVKDLAKLENAKTPSLYPESLPPFEHAKEGINKCLTQLENQDWEITIQGLQSVVRLARHHPSILTQNIHSVSVALAKHIRSLRSQVARAACQAAAQLFTLQGRALENDVEDLVSALFSRTADTNRFLRADCNHALDCMAENISPVRSIPAVLSKGAKHQNAVVRTAACRMLVDLCNRVGAERVLGLPRDIRDGILNAGAKLLTEGSLDTRKYAKELFTLLSKDSRLPTIMAEVIPNSLMRNISKTMNKLQTKKS